MTATLPTPQAARLRAPSWRDTRLVVGVLLVLGSVVAGARVVGAADDTSPVWAAGQTLASGSPLDSSTLTIVRVHLGNSDGRYLSATAPPERGLVALRTIGAGELVPVAAAGPAQALQRRAVVVPLVGRVPSGVDTGSQVDVWVADRQAHGSEDAGDFKDSRRVVTGAEVAGVHEEGGALTVGGGATVEVLLPESSVREVIDALANEARVTLVPVPGTDPRGRR